MKTQETFINIEKRDQYIREIANNFQKSRILFSSLELDVFTVIGTETKAVAQIAEEVNANLKSLEKLLNALVNMGFLLKKGDTYTNKPDSLIYLSRESPNYLGDLMHIASLWDNWSNLTQTIRIGKPIQYQDISEKSDSWLESFILSSFRESKKYADLICKQVPAKNPFKILDLGAGSGVYAIEFAKMYPKATVYALELPRVANITKKFIDRSGLNERIKVISADMITDDFGKDYDLVILSDVLSEFSFKTNLDLMKKIYDSLNFNGVIAVFDYFYNDDKTGPQESTMQALNMMINTLDGEVLNNTDIWFALKEAWFMDIYKVETNFGKSLIIGKK